MKTKQNCVLLCFHSAAHRIINDAVLCCINQLSKERMQKTDKFTLKTFEVPPLEAKEYVVKIASQ